MDKEESAHGIKRPAEQLLGRTLSNGWKVTELMGPKSAAEPGTGGVFSAGYLVERDGKKAFLKALDLLSAFGEPDPARALQAVTTAFNFERDILEICRREKLSRVVQAIDAGIVHIDSADPFSVVQYLVFELADGDVRRVMQRMSAVSAAWKLRTLHEISVALFQLHSRNIAHQDLKPSNVLVFDVVGSKLGDFGRVSLKGVLQAHDEFGVIGDHGYAPPEPLKRLLSL